MKAQLQRTEDTMPAGVQTKQSLYNRYAGMLLGYLLEVVKSAPVAEQCLVEIFSDLQFAEIQSITKPGVNTFCQLQQIARRKLASFTSTVADCEGQDTHAKGIAIKGNNIIDLMGPEQQHVFCGMHYHGKTTAMLASELNKPEDAIKRILKESFTIIRNQRNDTATVHR